MRKSKALEALRPLANGSDEIERNTLRGQYTASRINGELVEGYREEQGVSDSNLLPKLTLRSDFLLTMSDGRVLLFT